MATRRNGRGRFKTRPFIDSDGFRWWLEEDRDHFARSLADRF